MKKTVYVIVEVRRGDHFDWMVFDDLEKVKIEIGNLREYELKGVDDLYVDIYNNVEIDGFKNEDEAYKAYLDAQLEEFGYCESDDCLSPFSLESQTGKEYKLSNCFGKIEGLTCEYVNKAVKNGTDEYDAMFDFMSEAANALSIPKFIVEKKLDRENNDLCGWLIDSVHDWYEKKSEEGKKEGDK